VNLFGEATIRRGRSTTHDWRSFCQYKAEQPYEDNPKDSIGCAEEIHTPTGCDQARWSMHHWPVDHRGVKGGRVSKIVVGCHDVDPVPSAGGVLVVAARVYVGPGPP
jgi:hypothetical protein